MGRRLAEKYLPETETLILEVMADIKEAATCISFIEHSEQEHSHVHSWLRFTIHGDVNHTQPGCWAFVGKQGGEQVINLTPPDCHTREVVTHEVMHSLGVFHEHNKWEVYNPVSRAVLMHIKVSKPHCPMVWMFSF